MNLRDLAYKQLCGRDDAISMFLHLHDCNQCKKALMSIIRHVSTLHALFKLHSILIQLEWLYRSQALTNALTLMKLHLVATAACKFKFGVVITYWKCIHSTYEMVLCCYMVEQSQTNRIKTVSLQKKQKTINIKLRATRSGRQFKRNWIRNIRCSSNVHVYRDGCILIECRCILRSDLHITAGYK